MIRDPLSAITIAVSRLFDEALNGGESDDGINGFFHAGWGVAVNSHNNVNITRADRP
jgi:hypothetical protein